VAMMIKGNSSRSWDWRQKKRAGISSRNSTLNLEKYEGEERRGINVLLQLMKVNYGLEKKVLWEKMWEIQDRIYKRREIFPLILERKYERKKEEERQGKGLITIV